MQLDLEVARRLAELPAEEFLDLVDGLDEGDLRYALVHRFRFDVEGFLRYCWPDRFSEPFNELHHELIDVARYRPAWHERTDSVRDARAAPRGYAKSTISSFGLLAHRIVYGLEVFIILASAESDLAVDLSTDLRQAFLDEESAFRDLYGPCEVTGGVKGWRVSVQGAPSVAVLPRSERSAIRGRKHPTRGQRPSLIVLDDAEDKVRVLNPRLRAFTWNWLTKDVLKAGRKGGGTDVWWRGTVLHTDAALARLISGRERGWVSKRYQAIEAWPTNRKLWERCHQIWSDLELGEHRATAARAFYEAHKAEMDEGAKVLGGLDNLYPLHEVLWGEGLASFLQELQNDPIDPSARVFEPERWRRCRIDGGQVAVLGNDGQVTRRVDLSELRRVAWWDPTVGGVGSDFGAIAVLGRDRHGYTYVLDVWCQRERPDAQLAALWRLCATWGVREAWFEDNGFQELVARTFPRQRDERRERGEFWQVQLLGETSSENKEERIAAMQPDMANGWLIFSDRLPAEVDEQAAAFPNGAHDDALDAIERAWTKLGGAPIRMEGNPFAKAA